MKISFPLNNPRINLIELLNFQMWKIIYDLNTDIIQEYKCILQTESTLEYIYLFKPVYMLPSFYIHTLVTKENGQFIAKNIHNENDKEYANCIKLNTYDESVIIQGKPHSVIIIIDISIKMDTLPAMIEPIILAMFKKIYVRLNDFISAI